MATLRGVEGCEWDREQTHQSLAKYLIEETHELVDAIEAGDRVELREELGDVLYQVLFHADIASAEEQDPFDIDDVARVTNEKMRRRHPHVFGEVEVAGIDDIKANWQLIKAEEKKDRESVLDGVPRSLDGVARAIAVLHRAERVGESPGVDSGVSIATEDELGAWLLQVINSARVQGLDVDRALRGALRDFEGRVRERETTAGS